MLSPEGTVFKHLLKRPIDAPVELGDQIWIAKMLFRSAVAFKTPAHAQHLMLGDDFHPVDATVAGNTTHTPIDVSGMAEIDIIREIVYPQPLHWHAGDVAVKKRLDLRAVLMNLGMTVHAGLGGRNRRVIGEFHRVMAIATVEAHVARMEFMTERHGLRGLKTHIRGSGAETVGHDQDHIKWSDRATYNHHGKEQIAPFREDIMVSAHGLCAFFHNLGDAKTTDTRSQIIGMIQIFKTGAINPTRQGSGNRLSAPTKCSPGLLSAWENAIFRSLPKESGGCIEFMAVMAWSSKGARILARFTYLATSTTGAMTNLPASALYLMIGIRKNNKALF